MEDAGAATGTIFTRMVVEATMEGNDLFSEYYGELLDNTYDCVDRIVLNAYFQFAQSPGGFRIWWRNLYGDDDNLDDTHLMRMAGRFSRRVHGWGKKNSIPVIHCIRDDRKHKIAEERMPKDPDAEGIFLVLVSRAPAPVWKVTKGANGYMNIERKKPLPFVNHYSFHILDPEWGHMTVKMCGHPPFGAQICLNGHEYVARKSTKKGIAFRKEDNCFTEISQPAELAEVADTLRHKDAVGHLTQACRRWLYRCLNLALDVADQKRTRFVYDLSVYQVEYSRNLLFERGGVMEQIFDGIIDRTRAHLDIRTVKTLFGYKHRPWKKGKKPRFELVIEKPTYDLTVFKVHFGKQALKIYTKGERVLRIEAITHNTRDLRCGKVIERFPVIVNLLGVMVERFLNVIRCLDITWLPDDTMDSLPQPSQWGATQVAGLDINKPRVRTVMKALLALSPVLSGFSVGELSNKVSEITGAEYTCRQASYDLKKFRAKGLVAKRSHSRRYELPLQALRTIAALLTLRDKVIRPLLAGAGKLKRGPKPKNYGAIDAHYEAIQKEMQNLFQALKIAA